MTVEGGAGKDGVGAVPACRDALVCAPVALDVCSCNEEKIRLAEGMAVIKILIITVSLVFDRL